MRLEIPFLDPQASKIVKEAMGYRDGSAVCRNCKYFEPSTGPSGALVTHDDYCTRNAFGLNVKPEGTCNHFSEVKRSESGARLLSEGANG